MLRHLLKQVKLQTNNIILFEREHYQKHLANATTNTPFYEY